MDYSPGICGKNFRDNAKDSSIRSRECWMIGQGSPFPGCETRSCYSTACLLVNKGRKPPMATKTNGKRTVRYFISYTRDDEKIPDALLKELGKQLGASGAYEFVPWRDTGILVGKDWDGEIKKALEECDFGLLLVSPAFLGKKYITEQELPVFVGDRKKPCIPVTLRRIDFEDQDLKGLKAV